MKTIRVKKFKEHRCADLIGSLRNKVKVRGDIVTTGVRWNQDNGMGATYVTVTIRNPAEPDRTWEGLFLVDTGATDSLVPRQHLEAIGLKPEGQRSYELADGSELKMDITVGQIEFMGEFVGGTILFGETDAEPTLGATALASAGIEVDPLSQRLKRRAAVRLKSIGGR